MRKWVSYIALLLFLFSLLQSTAQETEILTRNDIKKFIAKGEKEKAHDQLDRQLHYYKTQKKYDSLVMYFEFVGSYALANENWKLAETRSEAFAEELLQHEDPFIKCMTLIGLAGIYYEAGDPKTAYDRLLTARPFISQSKGKAHQLSAEVEYDLGYYSQELSNYPAAKRHYLNTIDALKRQKKPDYVSFQRTYNAIAGIYWALGKMDSTQNYFENSLLALKKAPDAGDFMNEYYRPALLQMNMAVVSQALGKNNEAISFTENAVKLFQQFLDSSIDEQRKQGARRSQLASIDNLGVFYSERGEFKRAEELINYSYQIKKKLFDKDDGNVILSKVILAQSKINTQDLDGAAMLLDDAIEQMERNENVQILWRAMAYTTRASIYDDRGDYEMASQFYERGEQLTREALNGGYSKEFLEEMGTMATFYAKQNNSKKAINLAKEAYDNARIGFLKNTLREFNATTNLAQVYLILKDYQKAKNYSQDAIDFEYTNNEVTKTADSVLLQFEKPRALAINIKAAYELQPNRTEKFLLKLLQKVEDGVAILDQRKTVLKTHSDLTSLISQNQELFNLAKKIRLELYTLTNNEAFLNDIIELHESSLYNRIRSRLNFRQDIAFSGVPSAVLKREQNLKNSIAGALKENVDSGITNFFDANKNWKVFLDSIQQSYPAYYKMRYATIQEPLDGLQASIPKNTTIVRYLFIEKKLYALVVTHVKKEMILLPYKEESRLISELEDITFDEHKTASILYTLYEQLWKPIEDRVATKNVIIIPDGPLFNVSFETLSTKKASTYNEIIKNGLLKKHVISYNYSLLLLNSKTNNTVFNKNLIAFAPEFTGDMKQDYKISIKDSINTDNTYLTLLPQPFSADLAKKSSKQYGGEVFLNTNSTEAIFKNNAAEHKIIHIGTHAESNNINPELSRLIFAKSVGNHEDNSLYTYEIYNTNLSSNLAVLTACETGKPSYQPGEGMISLAHAFNYAGSESMLTSLWEIDEQSSTQIIGYFYKELAKGLPKDEALNNAKLKYLETAQGRTLSPQYWAGLVLIGDTTPIDLSINYSVWIWILVILFLVILTLLFLRKKKQN